MRKRRYISPLHLLQLFALCECLLQAEKQEQQPILFFERHQWKQKQTQRHKMVQEFVHKLRDKAKQHVKGVSTAITHPKHTTKAMIKKVTEKEDTPYCNIHNRDHIEGRWVYQDDIRKPSFQCCGDINYFSDQYDRAYCDYNNRAKHKCTAILGTYDIELVSSKAYAQAGGNACICQAHSRNSGNNDSSAIIALQKYSWQPQRCALLEWDAHRFCSLLGNRRIVIAGDSTIMQAGVTLLNRLIEDNAQCVRDVKLVRSDALFKPTMHPVCSSNDKTIVDILNLLNPNISIFSVGSHLTGLMILKTSFLS